MATYATISDVEKEYEGTIPRRLYEWLDRKLTNAERVLKSKLGDPAVWIAAGKCTTDDVRLVVCNMVLRLVRNPQGLRTQTAGPYSTTLDQRNAAGRLIITREDRQLLGLPPEATTMELLDETLPYLFTHDGPRSVQMP